MCEKKYDHGEILNYCNIRMTPGEESLSLASITGKVSIPND